MSDLVARLRDDDTTRRIGESYADTHERRQRDRDEAADRIEQLEAALREIVAMAVTHHAEDVARTDWSGSGTAQKKARAVATRSGLLMHKIMTIARAALEEAAKVADAEASIEGIAQRIAAAIRALKETK